MNRVLAVSRAESVLLLRNRTAAGTALALPLLFGAFFVVFRADATDWAVPLTLQLIAALGLSVYLSTTTTLTARRQDLTLKRLRGGEAADAEILIGVLGPLAVLGVVQGVLMTAIAVIAGAPVPADPAALALAIVGGTATGLAVGLLTAAVTRSPETAQFTTAPYFFATFGGAIWVLATPPSEVGPLHLAAPGGVVGDLVRTGLSAPPGNHPLWWSVLAIAAWTAVAWALGLRRFRWDKR